MYTLMSMILQIISGIRGEKIITRKLNKDGDENATDYSTCLSSNSPGNLYAPLVFDVEALDSAVQYGMFEHQLTSAVYGKPDFSATCCATLGPIVHCWKCGTTVEAGCTDDDCSTMHRFCKLEPNSQ